MNRRVPMYTDRVRIRHVEPVDYPTLHRIESDHSTLHTWRYRGSVPPLDAYENALWKQTDAILVVEAQSDGRIVGYHHLHDVDHRAGHGWFSVYAAPEERRNGLAMEGYILFVDWVFANHDLRWIYAHVFDQNFASFDSSVRKGHIRHVGTMRERVTVAGEPTDVHVLAASREMFDRWPLRRMMYRRRGDG